MSYHYPLGGLESKMRTATKKFLKAEAKKYSEGVRERNTGSSGKGSLEGGKL
jgi:hypothetical protein